MPKKNYAVTAHIMEYRQDRSDKFYQVFITESGICVLRWGRRGTTGQASATSHGSYDEAHDIGMRQVYSKRSKGYVSTVSDFKFIATEQSIKYALNGDTSWLYREYREAMESGEFAGAKDAVLKHYSDFAEQVKRLMDQASYSDSGEMVERLDALETVWNEISDKHAEVQIALNVAKQTVAKNLLGI